MNQLDNTELSSEDETFTLNLVTVEVTLGCVVDDKLVHNILLGLFDLGVKCSQVSVTDNGPGISDELQDQIFQPFVTTKQDGQGLGLALVSKVAKAHGGLVEVRSRPGQTTFSILLPEPNGEIS